MPGNLTRQAMASALPRAPVATDVRGRPVTAKIAILRASARLDRVRPEGMVASRHGSFRAR